MSYFCTPWKYQEISSFFMFLSGIKVENELRTQTAFCVLCCHAINQEIHFLIYNNENMFWVVSGSKKSSSSKIFCILAEQNLQRTEQKLIGWF